MSEIVCTICGGSGRGGTSDDCQHCAGTGRSTYDWRADFYEDGSPRQLPDDPEEFAADATSPSPEWPAIELDGEVEDLEGWAALRCRAELLAEENAA